MIATVNRISIAISCVAIFVMTLIGGLDVIGATILNRPFPAAYEITELLMVLTVWLAVSTLQARQMNINVDLFVTRMPEHVRFGLEQVAKILGAFLIGLIAWQAWLLAYDSLLVLEYSQGIYRIPVYPFKLSFAMGASLMFAQYLSELLGLVREIGTR